MQFSLSYDIWHHTEEELDPQLKNIQDAKEGNKNYNGREWRLL
jgi:hypothetical protein